MVNKSKNIISMKDFSKENILSFLAIIDRMEKQSRLGVNINLMKRKTLGLLFEEDHHSRLAFELAMKKLGGDVFYYNTKDIISHARIVSGYCDILATKSASEGTSKLVSELITKPVVNFGEPHQNPCAIFQILHTIRKTQNNEKLDGLNIGIIGNFKYNKFLHSLIFTLSLFKVKLYLISPEELQLPIDQLKELNQKNILFVEGNKIESVIGDLDVLYHNDFNKNEFVNEEDYNNAKDNFFLSKNNITGTKKNFSILSALPNEFISKDVDSLKCCAYFMQNVSLIYIAQALIGISMGIIKSEIEDSKKSNRKDKKNPPHHK